MTATWTIVLRIPANFNRVDYLGTIDMLLGKYNITRDSFRIIDDKLHIYAIGHINEMHKICRNWLLRIDKISKKVNCSLIK